MRGVLTGIRTVRRYARCLDCGKAWSSANALAVAARHCAAYGHTVTADAATCHTYTPTSSGGSPSPAHRTSTTTPDRTPSRAEVGGTAS